MIDVASKIRHFRKLSGLSAKELAATLDVSQSFVSGLENGSKKCSLETLDKICIALRISLAQFFADTQESEQELLPPEVRRVIDKVKGLPPDKLKILVAVLDSWTD